MVLDPLIDLFAENPALPKEDVMRYRVLLPIALLATTALAQEGVYIRVVDAGPGLCTVVKMPGDHYMVYDAGHWNHDDVCLAAVKEVVPAGESIDLMVLSHSDADHLAAVDEIFDEYKVDRVIRSGNNRWLSKTWRQAYWAIRKARKDGDTYEVNLWKLPNKRVDPGFTTNYDDVAIVQVAGWSKPPNTWGLQNKSERNNAGSIVIRLDYNGTSVLFTGDTVGRHNGDPDDTCIAAEKFMVDNAANVPIDSDVLIAPHHGADNGSATCFIEAVTPDWVIFSAGHDHEHPRTDTANRYLDAGIQEDHLLRTDLGDYEGGKEWGAGQVIGMTDVPGVAGYDKPRDSGCGARFSAVVGYSVARSCS